MDQANSAMQHDVCRLRRLLINMACFDEDYSIEVAMTAPTLCASEYISMNLASASEIARRHGLVLLSDWIARQAHTASSVS